MEIRRPANAESTAFGAACLAGLGCGIFRSVEDLAALGRSETRFEPNLSAPDRAAQISGWRDALRRVRSPDGIFRIIDRWRPSTLRAGGRIIAPGVASTLIVALAATYLSDHYHAPPVIFALLLGMALNQLSAEARYAPGINVSARTLLRLSVALLGLRITFGQIGELGWSTAAMVIVTVPLTIGFGWLLAKAMKFDGRYGVLSGGAVGICGASAAMAIAVAWPRKDSERDTVVVIA